MEVHAPPFYPHCSSAAVESLSAALHLLRLPVSSPRAHFSHISLIDFQYLNAFLNHRRVADHVSFIKDVAATEPPQHLSNLLKMLKTRGMSLVKRFKSFLS